MGFGKRSSNASKINLQSLLALFTGGIGVQGLIADELPLVRWAGVSFAGDAVLVPQVYPNIYAIHKNADANGGISSLDKEFREMLGTAIFESVTLIIPDASNSSSAIKFTKLQGRNLALTVAFDGEHIEVEELGGIFAIRVWLSAQILVFDFEDSEIEVCYPVGVLLSSVSREKPAPAQIEDLVHKSIFGDGGSDEISLLREAAKIAVQIRPQDANRPKVQLAKVTLSERSLEFLPTELKENPRALKYFISNSFSKGLSAAAGISVLPYAAEDAGNDGQELAKTGGAMTVLMGTVSDAQVFTMRIPTPDYIFTINLEGFKKVMASQKPGVEKWIYGAYTRVNFQEPESRTVYLDQTIVNPWFEDIPAGTKISDWAAYQKSLYQLLVRVAENLRPNPGRDWVNGQSGKELEQQLSAVATKLEILP